MAEMASAFLCAQAGMTKTFDNSVAYIQSWIKTFKNDPKMVVMAASAAQRAVEYMQDGKPVDEEEEG